MRFTFINTFGGWGDISRKICLLNPYFKSWQKTAYSCIFCFFILVLTALNGKAAVFTVNTLADNQSNGCSLGQCTLREAVTDANNLPGSDTINFQSGLTGTILLANGYLPITSDITINGPGARVLSVSGNNSSRVFVVFGSNAVGSISGLNITNGNAQPVLFGSTLIGDGGGILNTAGGTLNLTDVHISGNSATSLGGGVATRAILPLLTTTTTNINRSAIYNNTAVLGGGGVSNIGVDVGLLPLLTSANTTIYNTTITQNNATAAAGGINNDGGHLNLTNNTITNNQSTAIGGGIVNVAGLVTGFVYMRNNILAQNNALIGLNLISSDGLGIINSLGHNLIGNNVDITASFAASVFVGITPQPNVNADLVGSVSINTQIINPLLGALANNGGLTDTRELLSGSPAINQADNCVELNNCPVNPNGSNPPVAMPTDQRGAGFLRRVNFVVDIGAFEVQLAPTAANVAVSGRVLDTSGNPLSRVLVLVTDTSGTTRSTVTNQFGYYRFEELEAGQTYVLSARHKIYSFTPRILQTGEGDLLDFDITVDSATRDFEKSR